MSAQAPVRNRFHYQEEQVFERPIDWVQIRRLLGYLRPYARTVAAATCMMLVATGARLAGPYLVSLAIDTALKAGDLTRLNWLAALLTAAHLVGWGANLYRIRLTHRAGQKALYALRQRLFAHIQTLSFKFFDGRPAGSILVRVTNDVNSLQDLFTGGIISLIQDLLTLAGIVVIMLGLHAPLAAVCFAFLPVTIAVTGRLRRQIRHGWQVVRIKLSRINAHLNEAIQGVRVTQAFVQEEENKQFFAHMNEENRRCWLDVMRRNALFNPVVEIMAAAGTMVVYWYGAEILREGRMTVGVLVAFVTYLGQFWEPINRLTQLYGQILVAMASSERIFELMDTRPAVTEKAGAPDLPPIRGRVELQEVVFEYEPGRRALDGVSLVAEPGQTIALVGHTGAGKTSIISLISRFYDVTAGAIRIDGHDVRDVTLASLRRQIGIVLQEPFLFTGTVMENIRYGRLDATDDEVIAAARAVGAHEFILRMPGGYRTEVRERGARLSMGERQLIAFARALLADPRILILDEATASIDTRTELLLQGALRTLLQGRTAFVIAHRLSTIRTADRIVVLEHGRIVEQGDHDSLMGARGVYYGLIQAQFRWLGGPRGA